MNNCAVSGKEHLHGAPHFQPDWKEFKINLIDAIILYWSIHAVGKQIAEARNLIGLHELNGRIYFLLYY